MYAQYIENLTLSSSYLITDEAYHHMIRVFRLKIHDQVILLDGNGLKIFCELESFDKKTAILKKRDHQAINREYSFDLFLGMPKKEALELSLKEATELGFRKIFLAQTAYSQLKVLPFERIRKLLISALEQSHGSFLPEIYFVSLEEMDYSPYSQILMMDSKGLTGGVGSLDLTGAQLLIVGPEGGFSAGEVSFLSELPCLKSIKLPTPILRTPTAVATGAGLMIHHLLK